MVFKLSYDEINDSLHMSIAKGDTFYFYDSLYELVPFFVEDLLISHPDAKFEANVEFRSSPSRCLHFVGPVTDKNHDVRSQYAYEEMDSTIVEGISYKRLVVDSSLYKIAGQCE